MSQIIGAIFACPKCDSVKSFGGQWEKGDLIDTFCSNPACGRQNLEFYRHKRE